MARTSKADSVQFYPTTVHLDSEIRDAVDRAGYTIKTAINAALLDFLENPMTRDGKLLRLQDFARSRRVRIMSALGAAPASGPEAADLDSRESSCSPQGCVAGTAQPSLE